MSVTALKAPTPQQMLERALAELRTGASPEQLLATAARWIDKWARLAELVEAGEVLDGRASIYSGETYAQALKTLPGGRPWWGEHAARVVRALREGQR